MENNDEKYYEAIWYLVQKKVLSLRWLYWKLSRVAEKEINKRDNLIDMKLIRSCHTFLEAAHGAKPTPEEQARRERAYQRGLEKIHELLNAKDM